jgi:predicted O-methyltransferase YrrM
LSRFLFSVYSYILHFVKRKDEHSLHSPFLFDFYNKTVRLKHNYLSGALEAERISLWQKNHELCVIDYGAKTRASRSKKLKTISKHSLAPKLQAAFLASMVDYLKPNVILEIGTSFGITTCYLAENAKQATICTLEGNDESANLAKERFERLGYRNIEIIRGNFDDTLTEVLKKHPKLDFVFFDGNHRYEPTMRYFYNCMNNISSNCTFVFHDIYWSKEMAQAWREICAHPTVMLSVDLYFFGIVFFRANQPKQHFVLKF